MQSIIEVIMSTSRPLIGGLSERPPPLDRQQRDAMEAGIDLHAAVMVEEVPVPAPPPLAEGPESQANPSINEAEGAVNESLGMHSVPYVEETVIGETSESPNDEGGLAEVWTWMKDNVHWYAISFAIHIGLFAILLLVLGRIQPAADDDAMFTPVDDQLALSRRLQSFDFPDGAPEQPTELDASVLRMPELRAAPRRGKRQLALLSKGGGRTNIEFRRGRLRRQRRLPRATGRSGTAGQRRRRTRRRARHVRSPRQRADRGTVLPAEAKAVTSG